MRFPSLEGDITSKSVYVVTWRTAPVFRSCAQRLVMPSAERSELKNIVSPTHIGYALRPT